MATDGGAHKKHYIMGNNKSKWKLIELLKSIKFWTIIGTMATVTATIIAIHSHYSKNDNAVVITQNIEPEPDLLEVYLGEDKLEDNDHVIVFYLLDEPGDFFSTPFPVYFYNPNKKAIKDITVYINTTGFDSENETYPRVNNINGNFYLDSDDDYKEKYAIAYNDLSDLKPLQHHIINMPIIFYKDKNEYFDNFYVTLFFAHEGLSENKKIQVSVIGCLFEDEEEFFDYIHNMNEEDKESFKDYKKYWVIPKYKKREYVEDGESSLIHYSVMYDYYHSFDY